MKHFGPWVAIVGLVLLLIVGASSTESTSENRQLPERLIAQAATAPQKSTSEVVSNPEFAGAIDQMIDGSSFASARWGVKVVSISSRATVYDRNSRERFIPASNMKIYTTAVALDLLGSDYRWRTSAYVLNTPDAAGTITGDLILYGRGSPDLVAHATQNSLEKLAAILEAQGVRRVKGSVIGDESYFRGSALGDGWQWNDLQWYFGAEASALTVNGNEVDLNMLPPTKADAVPAVRTSDRMGYVQLDNRMAPGNRAKRSTFGVSRGLSDNRVEVWGELSANSQGFGVRLSVHNPALWAAKIFTAALKARNIAVDGEPSSRSFRSAPSQRFDTSHAREIAYVLSAPLSEITRVTNKESNNLYAELILRTLGRERSAMLESPEPPGRERGDDEAGTELLKLWLMRQGVSPDEVVLRDGSGLSRLNLVTPDSTLKLLLAASRSENHAFRESLPSAGTDGTLRGRLKTVTGRVFAKTGSLVYVNSLSGYVIAKNGETLAFSVYCNDYIGRANSTRLIDQIVETLAGYPDAPPEKR